MHLDSHIHNTSFHLYELSMHYFIFLDDTFLTLRVQCGCNLRHFKQFFRFAQSDSPIFSLVLSSSRRCSRVLWTAEPTSRPMQPRTRGTMQQANMASTISTIPITAPTLNNSSFHPCNMLLNQSGGGLPSLIIASCNLVKFFNALSMT